MGRAEKPSRLTTGGAFPGSACADRGGLLGVERAGLPCVPPPPQRGFITYWPRRGPRASREGRSGARLANLLTPPGARGWAPQHRVRGAPAPPTPWTESTRGCKGAAGPLGPGPRAARTGRSAPR